MPLAAEIVNNGLDIIHLRVTLCYELGYSMATFWHFLGGSRSAAPLPAHWHRYGLAPGTYPGSQVCKTAGQIPNRNRGMGLQFQINLKFSVNQNQMDIILDVFNFKLDLIIRIVVEVRKFIGIDLDLHWQHYRLKKEVK